MPQAGYNWNSEKDPPPIEDHSIAKHEILESYLIRYAEVLAANPRIERLRLTLVDGFSGGGLYRSTTSGLIHEGSPLIFLRAMALAQAKINTDRRRNFTLDAEFFFVEQEAKTLKYLSTVISHQEDVPTWPIHYCHGTFDSQIDAIIEAIRSRGRAGRAIFLLDQYGYADVPLRLLRKILTSLPKAEVILTFGVDSLVDYLTDTDIFRGIISRLGISQHFNLNRIESLKRSTTDWRFLIQSQLYEALVIESSAKFFTPFFITSRQSHRSYWFLHLSNHVRARDEMAKLHWLKHTYFTHHGSAGLDMLGYDPKRDERLTGQGALPFEFDGSALRLTEASLTEDLPRVISRNREGISFTELLASTCNRTPATSDIYKASIDVLIEHGEIEVLSHSGGIRRSGSRLQPSDILRTPLQRRLALT